MIWRLVAIAEFAGGEPFYLAQPVLSRRQRFMGNLNEEMYIMLPITCDHAAKVEQIAARHLAGASVASPIRSFRRRRID